jgi:hypothetical protein
MEWDGVEFSGSKSLFLAPPGGCRTIFREVKKERSWERWERSNNGTKDLLARE